MRKLMTLCCCLILVGLAGCSQPPQSSHTILLWHWMTDRNDAFQKLAQQYKQETGTEVIVQLFAPSDAYSQKIIAAAQADVLPDIYGILDKKSIVADFIKAGLVADLTDAMKADGGKWVWQAISERVLLIKWQQKILRCMYWKLAVLC